MTFRTGDTPLPDIVILTHKLTRDYDMGGEGVRALRGIDIQIRKNEFVAVNGPIGAGEPPFTKPNASLPTTTPRGNKAHRPNGPSPSVDEQAVLHSNVDG